MWAANFASKSILDKQTGRAPIASSIRVPYLHYYSADLSRISNRPWTWRRRPGSRGCSWARVSNGVLGALYSVLGTITSDRGTMLVCVVCVLGDGRVCACLFFAHGLPQYSSCLMPVPRGCLCSCPIVQYTEERGQVVRTGATCHVSCDTIDKGQARLRMGGLVIRLVPRLAPRLVSLRPHCRRGSHAPKVDPRPTNVVCRAYLLAGGLTL